MSIQLAMAAQGTQYFTHCDNCGTEARLVCNAVADASGHIIAQAYTCVPCTARMSPGEVIQCCEAATDAAAARLRDALDRVLGRI